MEREWLNSADTEEVFPRISGSLLEECLQSLCFGVVGFSGDSCWKALVWTGSVLWHWTRLKPSEDELNICNFFKLQIYDEFYLFHNAGVQTSKSRCISNNQIHLDNCFTPPTSNRRALWSSTSVGTTPYSNFSSCPSHTEFTPLFFTVPIVTMWIPSCALGCSKILFRSSECWAFLKKTTWEEYIVLSKITQSKCSGPVQREVWISN